MTGITKKRRGEHKNQRAKQRNSVRRADYAQGLSDGCAGDKSKLFQNKNNKSYLRGHTAGTEMRKAEHHCTEHMYIAEATNGGSGQRVIRGKAEY